MENIPCVVNPLLHLEENIANSVSFFFFKGMSFYPTLAAVLEASDFSFNVISIVNDSS